MYYYFVVKLATHSTSNSKFLSLRYVDSSAHWLLPVAPREGRDFIEICRFDASIVTLEIIFLHFCYSRRFPPFPSISSSLPHVHSSSSPYSLLASRSNWFAKGICGTSKKSRDGISCNYWLRRYVWRCWILSSGKKSRYQTITLSRTWICAWYAS